MSMSHEYQALVFAGADDNGDQDTDMVQPIHNSAALHSPPKKKRPPALAPTPEEDGDRPGVPMPSPPSRGFRNPNASKRRILPLKAPPLMGALKPTESAPASQPAVADPTAAESSKNPLPPLKSKPGFQPAATGELGPTPASLGPLQAVGRAQPTPSDDDTDDDTEHEEETKAAWDGDMSRGDGQGAVPASDDPVAAVMRESLGPHGRASITSSVLDGSITSSDLAGDRRASSAALGLGGASAAGPRRTSTLKTTKQGVELVAAPGERFKLGTVRRASVEMANGGKPPPSSRVTGVAPLLKTTSQGVTRKENATSGPTATTTTTTSGVEPRRTSTSKYSRSARQLNRKSLQGDAATQAAAAAGGAKPKSLIPQQPNDPSLERRRRSSVWVTERESRSSNKTGSSFPLDNGQPSVDPKSISARSHLWFGMRVNIQYTMFMLLHGAASTAVFLHFFFKKWKQQQASLPAAAPHYWQKHWVPPVEFGFMHVVLLQFALFPITMCRFFLTKLRATVLNRYFPLDALTEFHQYIGIATLSLLVGLFALFLVHFGTLCAAHKRGTEPVDFCKKFTIEIMLTGYVIMGLVLIMLVTSLPAVRRRLPFEAFYWTHHLFLAVYVVVIIHTLDEKGRNEFHSRSQNVQFVAGPLALYLLDRGIRVWRTKTATIAEAHIMRSPKALVLKLRFKAGKTLQFKAGQYVQLKVPAVSKLQWHPFAIASSSRVVTSIEVFIQVIPSKPGARPTWTEQLYDKLTGNSVSGLPPPEVMVDGPYGSALEGAFTRKHVVMVATGTGIIPMLSLLRDIAAHGKIVVQGQGTLEVRDNVDPVADAAVIRRHVEKGKAQAQAQAGRPPLTRPGSTASTDTASSASTGGDSGTTAANSKKHAVFPLAASNSSRDVYFRDMMQRPFHALAAWMSSLQADAVLLAAHQHTVYFVTLVMAVVLDFFLLASEVSWRHNKPKMQEQTPWTLSGLLTVGLIVTHTVAMLAYRLPKLNAAHPDYRTFVSSNTDQSSWSRMGLELAVVGTMIVSVTQAWGDTLPTAPQLGLAALMRLYRMGWSCVHNPLFRIRQAGTVSERAKSAAFLKSIKLLWATSSFETFLALSPILDEVVGVLDVTTHAGYLDVKLNARHLTPTQKFEALEMTRESSLEGALEFGTPDFQRSLAALCDAHLKQHTQVLEEDGTKLAPPIGIVYCGNRPLASSLRASLIANPSRHLVPVSYIAETAFHDHSVVLGESGPAGKSTSRSGAMKGSRSRASSSGQRALAVGRSSVAPSTATTKTDRK